MESGAAVMACECQLFMFKPVVLLQLVSFLSEELNEPNQVPTTTMTVTKVMNYYQRHNSSCSDLSINNDATGLKLLRARYMQRESASSCCVDVPSKQTCSRQLVTSPFKGKHIH